MSTPNQQAPHLATTLERRFYPRFIPQTPILIAFDENEATASRLLNVSENGLLVSTATGFPCNFVTRLSIPLNGLPKPVLVTARVAWSSDTRKLAGIQLLDLSELDREQIRKWAAHQLLRAPQPGTAQHSLGASAFTSSPEVSDFIPAFSAGTRLNIPVGTPPDVAALAFPPRVRARSTSDADRRGIRLMLIAMTCLAAAVVAIKAAPGNPFARSKEIPPESITSPPPVRETESALPTLRNSDRSSVEQPASLAPPNNAGNSKHTPIAGMPLRYSPTKTAEGPRTPDENPARAQNDPVLTTAVPGPTGATTGRSRASSQSSAAESQKETSEEVTSLSPDPPTSKEPVPSRTYAIDSTAAAPATIPTQPSSSPSSGAASNAPVVPTGSVPSPSSVTPSLQADPPRNQILEVHIPSGRSGSLSLPGERLVESPSLTMHIQRSVLMPPTRAVWPFRRDRKVVVGELISHIDPQIAQPTNASAVSLCVKATIAADGRVENVKQILGPSNLVPAVAKALREWRYQPTLVDGKPVETQCYITFQFRSPAYHAAKR